MKKETKLDIVKEIFEIAPELEFVCNPYPPELVQRGFKQDIPITEAPFKEVLRFLAFRKPILQVLRARLKGEPFEKAYKVWTLNGDKITKKIVSKEEGAFIRLMNKKEVKT